MVSSTLVKGRKEGRKRERKKGRKEKERKEEEKGKKERKEGDHL